MPPEQLTAAVAQHNAQQSVTALNSLQAQNEAAQAAHEELEAASQSANAACVEAEEKAAANPDDENLKEAKREVCSRADDLAGEAALSSNAINSLKAQVQQAQVDSESAAAISAQANQEEESRLASVSNAHDSSQD